MILVGLTGGIGSGKSTVSQFFKTQGATIVDADRICHALIQKGNTAYQTIRTSFGQQILDARGEVDRKKLGDIVFRDPQKRTALNKILHPLVFHALKLEQNRLKDIPPPNILIFDAPLLIESKAHEWMDKVILVYVDATTQQERLLQRGELTENEAKLRIAAQMPLDKKRPFADEIIDNRKPLEQVQSKVHEIYRKFLKNDTRSKHKTPA